jgi:hypothetical protein
VFQPEMSRALADQHVRDLHRRAATSSRLDAPPSPVTQHWAVLAVRLHLRRARAAATTPVGSASVPASRPARAARATTPTSPAGSAPAGPAPARQPMGCIA